MKILPIGCTVRAGRLETAVCLLRKMSSSTGSPVTSSHRRSKWSSSTMPLSCSTTLTPSLEKLFILSYSSPTFFSQENSKSGKGLREHMLETNLEGGARVPTGHGQECVGRVQGRGVHRRRHQQRHHFSCVSLSKLVLFLWSYLFSNPSRVRQITL